MKKIAVLVMLIFSMVASSLTLNASSTGAIVGPDVIHKQSNQILTINDILSMYSSSLGQVYVQVDGYTGNGNILGAHPLLLKAANQSSEATKEIYVMVVSTLGNVLAVSDYKNIHLRANQTLTPSEIVLVLEKTGHIEITATTQMMILTNTYTENANQQGQYLFEFRLMNSAGVDQIYSSYIFVSSNDNVFVPDIVFTPPRTAWDLAVNIFWLIIYGSILYVIGYTIYKFKKKKEGRRKVVI
jgi:hypothetical protein